MAAGRPSEFQDSSGLRILSFHESPLHFSVGCQSAFLSYDRDRSDPGAAQRAGLNKVSAIVKEVPDELALEMTLVENIQREDLNPMEAARAFERLMDEFHLTQDAVAERTGKDRATVANAVRLLKLDKQIQEWIEEGKLSAGHGRALLAAPSRSCNGTWARESFCGRRPRCDPGSWSSSFMTISS